MTTTRENILQQLTSDLSDTAVVAGKVYRSRVVPLQRNESPAIVIEPVSDTPDETVTTTAVNWELTVRISVIVRGEKPDQIADPIIESLYSKVMADASVNDYAIDIRPGAVNFEMIDADQPAGVISNDFIIKYRTRFDDLTQVP